ncbi:hypothetical protein PQQ96_39990, partial [Paraburkholderia sediminicola]|uniref:hypothetical protein n=1 Tax=Paraburkholderia sediminicola TaxID=458836 RepID=UPI0038BB0BB1
TARHGTARHGTARHGTARHGVKPEVRLGLLTESKGRFLTSRKRAPGFPCIPIRDARSAEWELMSALSLTLKVQEHGFQMHHYRDCARDPLKN